MKPNRSIPQVTVIPVLVYPDVRAAVDYLTNVFGFAEHIRIGEDHRSQMRIGDDGAVIIADVRGQRTAPTPGVETHLLKVRVEDVRAQYERVKAHGASITEDLAEQPFGELQFTVDDLAGHRWQFCESVRDVDPEEWGGTVVGD
ncbi:VOC family protein [Catenulispora pinisilvae]|uniref:VOC family protein n=1 Tax=Catenulispora pinisilvae TaxID=2705253 RepID=UPI0018923CAA|nr:VOC family protein [Catenulispora pinisilvae]